jgi:hypothetical protein
MGPGSLYFIGNEMGQKIDEISWTLTNILHRSHCSIVSQQMINTWVNGKKEKSGIVDLE